MPAEFGSRLILVDTSAFFAIADKSDQHHAAALDFVGSNERPLVTTDLIIVETLNLVQARLGTFHALRLGKRLLHSELITTLRVSPEDMRNAWEIFQRYRDKEFSFTDCTCFVLMERMAIDTAFAFDIHFRQYARFAVLP